MESVCQILENFSSVIYPPCDLVSTLTKIVFYCIKYHKSPTEYPNGKQSQKTNNYFKKLKLKSKI